MEMGMVDEIQEARRRWARWYPKKQDDTILERWAKACSRINNDCRDCDSAEECQDLADRLIVCMSVSSGRGGRRQRGQHPGQGDN